MLSFKDSDLLLLYSWGDFFFSCIRSKITSSLQVFWKNHRGCILLFYILLSIKIHCQPLLSTVSTPTDKHEPPGRPEHVGRFPPGSPEEQGRTKQKQKNNKKSIDKVELWKISLVFHHCTWINSPSCLHNLTIWTTSAFYNIIEFHRQHKKRKKNKTKALKKLTFQALHSWTFIHRVAIKNIWIPSKWGSFVLALK